MVKIYESPDGGKTVYERDTETGDRICIEKEQHPDWYIDPYDFDLITEMAKDGNKTLQNLLKEVKLIFELSFTEDN